MKEAIPFDADNGSKEKGIHLCVPAAPVRLPCLIPFWGDVQEW
jgi:hypothetical protein